MKQAILLVHGMGTHTGPTDQTSGSFHKEFVDATTESLQCYANHNSDKLENHIDIHEFNYDDWLNKMRTEMADNAKSMKDRLAAVSAAYGASVPLDLVGRLNGFENDFGEDSFFYTHWLDVIFYGTMLGAKIRVDAGLKVAELVQDYGAGNVHVVAHSLGTAVMHDTLHLLYRPAYDPNDAIPDLHLTNHKLGSVWMIANVSRLVNCVTRITDPLSSVVRPGDNGCANAFFNVRHELDPFTWLARFNPPNNGSWISEDLYNSAYNNIVTNLVVDGNTHSFTQYLQDPKVAECLFYQLLPEFKVDLQEMDKVSAEYSKKSINGAYASLEDSLRNIEVKDISTWREFLDAASTFKDAVDRVKASF